MERQPSTARGWLADGGLHHDRGRQVRSFLLNTRYWWLEGGDTKTLRRKLAEVFDQYDIENLAPGYGKVLRGRELVERQYRMLDEVLAGLDKSVVDRRYVDRDELS